MTSNIKCLKDIYSHSPSFTSRNLPGRKRKKRFVTVLCVRVQIFFSWAPKSVIVTAIVKLINHDVKRCLLLGRKAMTNLGSSVLKNRDITLLTKVHIVKAMVFPVVMYRYESWTHRKKEG